MNVEREKGGGKRGMQREDGGKAKEKKVREGRMRERNVEKERRVGYDWKREG